MWKFGTVEICLQFQIMLGRMSARAAAPPPRWLVTPAFDLTWFFGGAALSLIVLGLYVVAGAPIVALWWIRLLAFDGPHIGAAFTRTYFDRDEWRRRPGLLLTSLLTFALGPLFLAATIITGSANPFLLFLGLATFYLQQAPDPARITPGQLFPCSRSRPCA
jgi:hypothetical protein